MTSMPVHVRRLTQACQVEVRIVPDHGGIPWDGGVVRVDQADFSTWEWSIVWHELCHWMVAGREWRKHPNFGLGLIGRWWEEDNDQLRLMPQDEADRYEVRATLLALTEEFFAPATRPAVERLYNDFNGYWLNELARSEVRRALNGARPWFRRAFGRCPTVDWLFDRHHYPPGTGS